MLNSIRIVSLMEDSLCGDGLVAEHGFSVYVETPLHKLLVDTGQSERTWDNAERKGIDVTKVDTVILSHGHYDHSGGLLKLAAMNPSAHIYMRENAGGEYYSLKEAGETYIGIDKAILKLPRVHLLSGNTVIDEELSVFTGVQAKRLWPRGNLSLHEKKGNAFVQDTFSHEMYAVIRCPEEKYILISGCAHNGILNILDSFRDLYGTDPAMVISGFHMILPEYTKDDLRKIREVGEELARMDTVFYSGHCTGDTAYDILKECMGDRLAAIREL